MVLIVIYAFFKKRWILTLAIVVAAFAMMCSGAPIDTTGNFLYDCGKA